MTFGACCFGEVSALARTGLFTTSFGDASAVSAALDFARCWPRCFSHVSTSQQVCWVLLPDSCFSTGQHNFRVGSGRALLESDVRRPTAEVRDEIESIADFRRRYEGHPAAIWASRAPRSAPRRRKNSNPPEAGDRPLGGGPGCHIVRVGALELSEKHLAGEQLSSLARGRPAGYGGAPAARAEVWARKQTASRQPKRVS